MSEKFIDTNWGSEPSVSATEHIVKDYEYPSGRRRDFYVFHEGLTKREHTCIALRIPASGNPELDALIAQAQRRDVAAMVLNGILSSPEDSALSDIDIMQVVGLADLLLAELAKREEK